MADEDADVSFSSEDYEAIEAAVLETARGTQRAPFAWN